VDLQELLQRNFTHPMRMFFTEPILFVITIYPSLVYWLLYIFLTAYPLVFEGVHECKIEVDGLLLFGICLGMILAGVASALVQPGWRRKYRANNDKVVPEWRMPLNIIGGDVFTIGLFWFSWTGRRCSTKIMPVVSVSYHHI
jgi:MFS transporter, DHA1 family, multidrug resistance protein